MNPNGGSPLCGHHRLRRLIERRYNVVLSARAEGREGWCEECRTWVDLAPPAAPRRQPS